MRKKNTHILTTQLKHFSQVSGLSFSLRVNLNITNSWLPTQLQRKTLKQRTILYNWQKLTHSFSIFLPSDIQRSAEFTTPNHSGYRPKAPHRKFMERVLAQHITHQAVPGHLHPCPHFLFSLRPTPRDRLCWALWDGAVPYCLWNPQSILLLSRNPAMWWQSTNHFQLTLRQQWGLDCVLILSTRTGLTWTDLNWPTEGRCESVCTRVLELVQVMGLR